MTLESYCSPAGDDDQGKRQRLASRLRLGPWCWPLDAQELACASTLVPEGPTRQIGLALLVSIASRRRSLWSLQVSAERGPAHAIEATLDASASAAWYLAAAVLQSSVPILSGPLNSATVDAPGAYWLAGTSREPELPTESVLRGDSFGLAFLLAIASAVFRRPIEPKWVALARVFRNGSTAHADGLSEKIRVVGELAPVVSDVVISAYQRNLSEAEEAAKFCGLMLHRVRSAGEALDLVFGDLSEILVPEGAAEVTREEFVRSLESLVHAGHHAILEWSPVLGAAKTALRTWESILTKSQVEALGRVVGVAGRRAFNEGAMPAFNVDDLASLGAQPRIWILRQLVQQSADTGLPEPVAIVGLAERFLPSKAEEFVDHLKVRGALARLAAVTGRPAEALETQEQLAHRFEDFGALRESSHQLSEWIRLASTLNKPDALARAENFFERVILLGSYSPLDRAYLDLARLRARVLGFGTGDPGVNLWSLASSSKAPDEVRFSALRWLVRWRRESGDLEGAREALSELTDAPLKDAKRISRIFAALAELDSALADGKSDAIDGSFEKLREYQPGIVSHLSRAAEPGAEAPYVARFFPY